MNFRLRIQDEELWISNNVEFNIFEIHNLESIIHIFLNINFLTTNNFKDE